MISPKRLILGGAAILMTENRNHHRAKIGRSMSIPLAKRSLRLWVFSYV